MIGPDRPLAVVVLAMSLTLSCNPASPKASDCEPGFLALTLQEGKYPPDIIQGRRANSLVSGQIAIIGCRDQLEKFQVAEIKLTRERFQKVMERDGFGFVLGARVPSYRREVAATISADGSTPSFNDFFLYDWSFGEQLHP